jgi:cell division protein FtsL
MVLAFDDRDDDLLGRRPRRASAGMPADRATRTSSSGATRRAPAPRRAAPGAPAARRSTERTQPAQTPAPAARRAAPATRREPKPLARRPQKTDRAAQADTAVTTAAAAAVIPARPLRSLRPTRAPAREAPPNPTSTKAPTAKARTGGATAPLHRADPMRTRTHGGATRRQPGVVRTTVWPRRDHPMVRITAGVQVGPPQPLVVVPRRRRTARVVAVAFGVIFALMLVAAAFQTQLASRQVALDKVERSIRDANQQYNDLRRQRSELRAPERLATAAEALGMRPSSSTEFVSIDPQIVALVQQTSGGVFDTNAEAIDPLVEFSRVKSIAGSAP